MGWIALVMLVLIALSLVLEWILPMRLKDSAGAFICWSLMAITMAFLGLSTIGLAYVIGRNVILPLFT
ncbi:MAG: hypothetical protein V3T14_12140 [Myxococcota bacterium]